MKTIKILFAALLVAATLAPATAQETNRQVTTFRDGKLTEITYKNGEVTEVKVDGKAVPESDYARYTERTPTEREGKHIHIEARDFEEIGDIGEEFGEETGEWAEEFAEEIADWAVRLAESVTVQFDWSDDDGDDNWDDDGTTYRGTKMKDIDTAQSEHERTESRRRELEERKRKLDEMEAEMKRMRKEIERMEKEKSGGGN